MMENKNILGPKCFTPRDNILGLDEPFLKISKELFLRSKMGFVVQKLLKLGI